MRSDWRDEAWCIDKVDVMFPDVEPGHTGSDVYVEARKICARCPVIDTCRRVFLDPSRPREKHGFRAGMNPSELRRARDAQVREVAA